MVRCLPSTSAQDEVAAGRLADFPTMEPVFPRMRNPACRINMAITPRRCLCNGFPAPSLIQLGPRTPALCRSFDLGSQPLCSRLAALIVDTLPLAPPDIEERFGISGGIFTTWTTPSRLMRGSRMHGQCRVCIQQVPAVTPQEVCWRPATMPVRVLQDLGKPLSELVFRSRLNSCRSSHCFWLIRR